MLSLELITRLQQRGRSKKTPHRSGYAIVRNEDGKLEKVDIESVEIGAFGGRAGTVRRSRKGRTYRAPNGRRKYEGVYQDKVVSYKFT